MKRKKQTEEITEAMRRAISAQMERMGVKETDDPVTIQAALDQIAMLFNEKWPKSAAPPSPFVFTWDPKDKTIWIGFA